MHLPRFLCISYAFVLSMSIALAAASRAAADAPRQRQSLDQNWRFHLGEVGSFIDLQDVKDYITLHPLRHNEPYYLGIYLTGAYQDIMGDLHNLFGRVNEVHVFLEDDEPNGYYIEEALAGSRISDVIEGVQYQWEELCRKIKQQIDHATKKDLIKPREGVRLVEFYESQMLAKTYLNIEQNGKKKR